MKKSSENLDGLLSMFVFAVFAACVMLVLVTGAKIYRRVTDRDLQANSERVISRYITTRVRGAESPESVRVREINGTSVLGISELLDGEEYVFYIYLGSDGVIRELYTAADAVLYPDSGEKLIEADSLSFSLENGLLKTEFAVNGCERKTVSVNLRGRESAS